MKSVGGDSSGKTNPGQPPTSSALTARETAMPESASSSIPDIVKETTESETM